MTDSYHELIWSPGDEQCPICDRWYEQDRITWHCEVCCVDCCDECVPGHRGSHSPEQDAIPLCVLAEWPEAQGAEVET